MKIIYMSYLEPDYSRSAVHFEYLQRHKNHDTEIDFCRFPTGVFSKLKPLMKLFLEHRNEKPVFLVMSPASSLVIYLRILGFRRIIFDGGWPLSDAAKIRGSSKVLILLIWLTDFMAIHLASYFICESNEQLDKVQKAFFVNSKKLKTNYTGFSEFSIEDVTQNPSYATREFGSRRYIFFRGKNNIEAGLSTIIEAARLLEDSVDFVIASPGNKLESLSKNVFLIDQFLLWPDIAALYRGAFLALGQMTDENRISRTIPHKFFEAAYFGKAYVTALSTPIRNLTSKSIFEVPGRDANALASKVKFLLDNPQLVAQSEGEMKKVYEQKLKPEILANQIMEIARCMA